MIRLIDYVWGNVQAFLATYKLLDIEAASAKVPSDLDDATHLILPGVGSFDLAMSLLEGSGMRETVESLVLNDGIPILGVCVGMQILASSSDEGERFDVFGAEGDSPPEEGAEDYNLGQYGAREDY